MADGDALHIGKSSREFGGHQARVGNVIVVSPVRALAVGEIALAVAAQIHPEHGGAGAA